MADNIQFTLMQRFGIETLLNLQTGSISELSTLYDIAKKIKIEKRDQFVLTLANGSQVVDQDAIDKFPILNIELEKAEVRKLLELLVGNKTFKQGDLEWVLPLKKQLDQLA